jgi:hypothetical protein
VNHRTDVLAKPGRGRLAGVFGDAATEPRYPHLAPAVVALQQTGFEPSTHTPGKLARDVHRCVDLWIVRLRSDHRAFGLCRLSGRETSEVHQRERDPLLLVQSPHRLVKGLSVERRQRVGLRIRRSREAFDLLQRDLDRAAHAGAPGGAPEVQERKIVTVRPCSIPPRPHGPDPGKDTT